MLALITFLGGLALFLFGMILLGEALENASGGKLERVLEKLTNNVIAAVALGALTTAAIQSSSATTVIVVGLVNARILPLRRGIGVIMGANIGTTITGQIIRLADISSDNLLLMLLKPTMLAPLAATAGILLYLTARRSTQKDVGTMLLGFAILFTGLFAMEHAVYPLRNMPEFTGLFASLSNPMLGVLAGTVVTAVIQSSSASVGILQALSSTGQLTYAAAFPIIMGQNIGTCATPLLASIGASKNARRAAMVHLSFNVIGTILFLIGTYVYQNTAGFSFWQEAIGRGGIADFHTLFNVACTLAFLPFVGLLERLACALVPDGAADVQEEFTGFVHEERLLNSPALALEQAKRAATSLAELALHMLKQSITLFDEMNPKQIERLKEGQNYADKLSNKQEEYIIKLSRRVLSDEDGLLASELLGMTMELRYISANIQSIIHLAQDLHESGQVFSEQARHELEHIMEAVETILGLTATSLAIEKSGRFAEIEALENVINTLTDMLKAYHIERLKAGLCSIDASFVFVAVLGELRKIADHCSSFNAMHYASSRGIRKHTRRDFSKAVRMGKIPGYESHLGKYQKAYQSPLEADLGQALQARAERYDADVW